MTTPPITREERGAIFTPFDNSDRPKRYMRAHGGQDWVGIAEDLNVALTAAEEENKRLREALRQIAEAHHMMIEPDLRRIARAALEGEGK